MEVDLFIRWDLQLIPPVSQLLPVTEVTPVEKLPVLTSQSVSLWPVPIETLFKSKLKVKVNLTLD